MRRLVLNSVSLSAGMALAQALSAFAYWLTARSVTPSGFGTLAAYIGVATLVATAADFGFNSWVVRELVRAGDPTVFRQSLGVRLVVAGSTAVAWVLVTGALFAAGVCAGYVPLLGVWIVLTLTWATFVVPLRASERMSQVAVIGVVERIVLAVVVSLGALAGAAVEGLVAGLVLGGLAACVLAFRSVEPALRRPLRTTAADVVAYFRSSAGFAFGNLALQAQRLDVAIVGAVSGSFSAGIYAAPSRLTNAIGILPTAYSASLFPRAARDTSPIWSREFRRGLGVLLGSMLLVVVPLFVFAEPLTVLLLGEQYRASADVLRVILVSMVVAAANQPVAVTYQARGGEHAVAVAVAAGSAVGLVAIAVGAAAGGATGAACGLLILQTVILAALLVRVPRPASPTKRAARVVPDANL